MDVLITMGTSSAYLYSTFICLQTALYLVEGNEEKDSDNQRHQFFETSVFLLVIVWLGKALEQHARMKTADAIAALIRLQPQSVTLVELEGDGSDMQGRGEQEEDVDLLVVSKEQVIDVGLVQVSNSKSIKKKDKKSCFLKGHFVGG